MDVPIRDAVTSAGRYVVQNPSMVARMLAHAIAFRLPIPLDAIRWLADNLFDAPGGVHIEAAPPGLELGGELAVMGNGMKASAVIRVMSIEAAPDTLKATVVVSDLSLVAKDAKSPMAQLLKSGALDLSKPAGLLKMMGKKPRVIEDASGDTFHLDLMQLPAVAKNDAIRRALNAFTPVLNVSEIFAEDDLLLIAFKATPGGLPSTLSAVREFFQPG